MPLLPRRLAPSVLILAVSASLLHAQDRTVEAVRLGDGQAVTLDGRLDEPFWDAVPPADGFLQKEPLEGAPATEATEVRIVYDDRRLYLGVLLHDSDPDGILGHQKQRDAFLFTDDRFMWILDTFRDGRTGYFFEINPAGMMADGLIGAGSGTGVNRSWDGIWEARVARGPYGWSAEVRIPFGTLNFNPELESWGINFQRTIRRKNEETIWSGHRRNQDLFTPVYAGRVTGLEGMSQGAGLEVKPYAIGSWNRLPARDPATETGADAGFDLTYSITSSLRAAASYNTDFAEVEVDQRRVNLTRFPLVFPEKRDFFLEGSEVFTFAPRNGADPYFSRRIGLVGGEPVPITYGLRLSGQEGPFDIGFLQVRTDRTDARPAEHFTVGRLKRNFWEQSSLGVIATRRAAGAFADTAFAPDRYTLGADLELTTRHFLGDRNLNGQAFLVWHNRNAFGEASSAWNRTVRGVRFRYPNDPWTVQTSYREYGDHYDPAVGFNRRNGYRRVEPQADFTPRLNRSRAVRELGFRLAFEHIVDLDNRLLTRGWEGTLLGVELESGDVFGIGFEHRQERLENAFNIYEDIVIAVDAYRFTGLFFETRTAARRKVAAGLEASRGSFWSGHRTALELEVTLRPMPGLSLEPSWEHNEVDLPEGAFTTNLARFTGGWQVDPWTSLTAIVQYDDVTELLTLFTRFRWTIRPGSDLYLVFSRNWENEFHDRDDALPRDRDRFHLRAFETGAALKVNYTHRF